jgi:hypothetical protein
VLEFCASFKDGAGEYNIKSDKEYYDINESMVTKSTMIWNESI